jgi:hypothetical protein
MSDKWKNAIIRLDNGQNYIIPESDYGKAEVWKINNMLILFGIPLYGGEPYFVATYTINKIDELIDLVMGWT